MSKYVGTGAIYRLLNIMRNEINDLKSKITDIPISNLKTITEENKYALDAIQNNPSISGSLANQIQALKNDLVFRRGEKYEKAHYHFGYGFCSPDHKTIWLLFPLPKRLDTNPSQFNVTQFQIFGDKGALDDVNISYTLSAGNKQGDLYIGLKVEDTINSIISDPTAKQVCLTAQLMFTMTV